MNVPENPYQQRRNDDPMVAALGLSRAPDGPCVEIMGDGRPASRQNSARDLLHQQAEDELPGEPKEPPRETDLVSLARLSGQLGISFSWLKREALHGRIPCLRAGRQYLFNLTAVRRAIAGQAAISYLQPRAERSHCS